MSFTKHRILEMSLLYHISVYKMSTALQIAGSTVTVAIGVYLILAPSLGH